MPISKEQPPELVGSFGSGIPPEALAKRLHPRQVEKIPTAPEVPRDADDAG